MTDKEEAQHWLEQAARFERKLTEAEARLAERTPTTPYVAYDFAGHLERWMRERGFYATSGASFVDLLDELSAQVSDRPRN